MNSEPLCPICEEGNLTAQKDQNKVEYKGKTSFLDNHFSICDCCGAEQANTQQIKTNKRLMIAFKKAVDGLLNGSDVRLIREQLGLKQSDAAKIFGGGPVAFSKYEANDVAQSEAMDKLLRVAAKVPEAFVHLAKSASFPVVEEPCKSTTKGWASRSLVTKENKSRKTITVLSSATLQQTSQWEEQERIYA